ncbi:MAG: 1,6-anhydro-N-acetylmuramyl-L-alanine amidase AmpD [Magnetococcales bacterium]|nr:1,6-anhydro-N-acetylmuramyl-L-alanine amidase AmpD [Magnetococcales bacterium]MBF0261563.1 1,6-anhydro-N-acetylmuramyl-L-alanine amidase AmpD [Magnetococcales bacterium]
MTAALVRYLPSPHADARPEGIRIDLLVVHAISLPPGAFGGPFVDDLFLGRLDPEAHPYFRQLAGLRVSAHFLIDRLGQLTQYVPVLLRAWHAGKSSWLGREACNDFSVGVELEGVEHGGFTPEQYNCLAGLARTLMIRLPGITPERIVGHRDIAPERKWDPGSGFDWEHFRALLRWARPEEPDPLVWDHS